MYPESFFGVVLALSLLATFSVALRLLARCYKKNKLGHDDAWICVAWIVLFGLNVNAGLMYLGGRAGSPWPDPRELDLSGMANMRIFMKCFYASTIGYFLCMLPVKLSVLAFYSRLFGNVRSYRLAIRVVTALCVCWFLGGLLPTIVQCRPPQKVWNRAMEGSCLNLFMLFRAITISNLLTDFIVLVVPVVAVLRLNLDRKARLTLLFLFTMGSLTCLVVLLRIVYQEKLRSADLSTNLADCILWTIAEPAVAILSANLPCLKPLIPVNSPLSRFVSGLSEKFSSASTGSSNTSARPRSWYGGPKGGTVTTTASGGGHDEGHPLNSLSGNYDSTVHVFYEQEYENLESDDRYRTRAQDKGTKDARKHTRRPSSGESSAPEHPLGIYVQREFSVRQSPIA